MTTTAGALQGLRILDLTHALAGPFCTQVLADHGASVIKIEPPEGDLFRRMGPAPPDDRERLAGGALFQSCNRNKRGIVLDLKQPAGRALFLQMVRQADAVVENFRAGVMTRLGLSYEALAAVNPRLVYTSVRGFGDDAGGVSPYRDWPAFDVIAQAMGGWMGITGPSPEQPTKTGGGPGDTVPGLFAAFGTLAALWRARATGLGQYVDVAMADSILALNELAVSTYASTGQSPQPTGNHMPLAGVFGSFPAADGVVTIAAPHQPQWQQLAAALEQPQWLQDPAYASDDLRARNREALIAEIERVTRRMTKAELKARLGGKVPFSAVLTAAEIFADPHFASRGMLQQVPHPGSAAPMTVPGVPVKLSATPGAVRHRAPLLGEHTLEVLREFGLDDAALAEVRAGGATNLR